jgi:AGCS family alanine or glycine:cation symporter
MSISSILFSFGTILGNAYNGEQCFFYSFGRSGVTTYFATLIAAIFLGTMLKGKVIWTISDYFVIPVAVPNLLGIIALSIKYTSDIYIKSFGNLSRSPDRR